MQEEGLADDVRRDHDQTASGSKPDFVSRDPFRWRSGPDEFEELHTTMCDAQLEPVSALLKHGVNGGYGGHTFLTCRDFPHRHASA
jgi:hypothetical protein